MQAARDIAQGDSEPVPLELHIGWLLGRYGVAIMGDKLDFFLTMRATKLADIYRVFAKLGAVGTKGMTPADFRFIRDVTEEMYG